MTQKTVKKSKYLEPLAVCVASGQTIKSAADTSGCSTQCAYNISATAEFRQRVSALRSEVTAQAVGLLSTGATQAAATLVELLDVVNEPKDRLAAAKAILAALGPIAELHELRADIQELRSQMNAPRLKVVQ